MGTTVYDPVITSFGGTYFLASFKIYSLLIGVNLALLINLNNLVAVSLLHVLVYLWLLFRPYDPKSFYKS